VRFFFSTRGTACPGLCWAAAILAERGAHVRLLLARREPPVGLGLQLLFLLKRVLMCFFFPEAEPPVGALAWLPEGPSAAMPRMPASEHPYHLGLNLLVLLRPCYIMRGTPRKSAKRATLQACKSVAYQINRPQRSTKRTKPGQEQDGCVSDKQTK
jgi:hypothetical protein